MPIARTYQPSAAIVGQAAYQGGLVDYGNRFLPQLELQQLDRSLTARGQDLNATLTREGIAGQNQRLVAQLNSQQQIEAARIADAQYRANQANYFSRLNNLSNIQAQQQVRLTGRFL